MATSRTSPPVETIATRCTARDALYSGQRLSPGQSLNQGSYVLTMQADCNLVLYTPTAIWSSGTYRKAVNCYALLTFTGNFGVYSGSGTRLWSSGTVLGIANYILILQPNRNLLLYGPARWSSRTNIATAGFVPVAINGNVPGNEEER